MKQWSRHWQMQTFERVWRTLGWRFHHASSKPRKPSVRSKSLESKSGVPSSRLAASRWSRAPPSTIAQVRADARSTKRARCKARDSDVADESFAAHAACLAFD